MAPSKKMLKKQKELKAQLVVNIKRDEWMEKFTPEKYREVDSILETVKRNNLELIKQQNEKYRTSRKSNNVGESRRQTDRESVDWRHDTKCPQVSTQKLLLLLQLLRTKPDEMDNKALDNCLKQQLSGFDNFWDRPVYILEAIRLCVLKRDWTKMTCFLLLLLNHSTEYLGTIKTMCRLMLKYNPAIKDYGLEEEFRSLVDLTPMEMSIV